MCKYRKKTRCQQKSLDKSRLYLVFEDAFFFTHNSIRVLPQSLILLRTYYRKIIHLSNYMCWQLCCYDYPAYSGYLISPQAASLDPIGWHKPSSWCIFDIVYHRCLQRGIFGRDALNVNCVNRISTCSLCKIFVLFCS